MEKIFHRASIYLSDDRRVITLPKKFRTALKENGWKDGEVVIVYRNPEIIEIMAKTEELEENITASSLRELDRVMLGKYQKKDDPTEILLMEKKKKKEEDIAAGLIWQPLPRDTYHLIGEDGFAPMPSPEPAHPEPGSSWPSAP